MDAKFLPSSLCPNSAASQQLTRLPSLLLSPSRRPRLRSPSLLTLRAIGPASGSNNEDLTTKKLNGSNNNDDNDSTINSAGNSTVAPPPRAPAPAPGTLNIRYRPRRLRKQAMQQEIQNTSSKRAPPPKKDWDDMTMGEKALEIYVGEKGLLFWLNKFAYASIFIIIGCWILFRFVGPSIGLYQLDTPPLSPSSIFKG